MTKFIKDVIAAAQIEHDYFKQTPRPITWLQAGRIGWRNVCETRKLDALFAELAE